MTFIAAERTADDIARLIADRDALGHATFLAETAGGMGHATCMEHTALLSPAARGLGLGRGLMLALCDHARAAGAHQMIAGVSAANPEGLAFHARLGFSEIARIQDAGFKFGRFIDLVLMQKFL